MHHVNKFNPLTLKNLENDRQKVLKIKHPGLYYLSKVRTQINVVVSVDVSYQTMLKAVKSSTFCYHNYVL